MFDPVHLDPPFLKPPCPKAVSRLSEGGRSEDVLLKKVSKAQPTSSPKALRVISVIPKKALALFKNEKLALFLVEVFGAAGKLCEFGGGKAVEFIPHLTLLAAPLYLYHACEGARLRLLMMAEAIKAHEVAEAFFYAGGAINAAGTALGDIAKGFAGGIEIAGVKATPLIGLIFTVVIPIVLIVTGSIGGLTKGWALWKNARALKNFTKKTKNAQTDLSAMVDALTFLQGPKSVVKKEDTDTDRMAKARFKLDTERLNNHYFTSNDRREKIQSQIDNLLACHTFKISKRLEESWGAELSLIFKEIKAKKGKDESLRKAQKLVEEVEELYEDILMPPNSSVKTQAERILALYEKIPLLLRDEKLKEAWGQDPVFVDILIQSIESNKAELTEAWLKEGNELLSLQKSDLHRLLIYNSLFVLMAALVFTAGVLFLVSPQYRMIATILSVSSGVIDIIYILFDKKVSQKQFFEIERFFQSLLAREKGLK